MAIILDADDVSYPERLQKQYELYQSLHGKKFGVIGSASRIIDQTTGISRHYRVKYGRIGRKRIAYWRICYNMPFVHSSFIYSRQALQEISEFPTEVTAWIDYFALVKIGRKYPVYAARECLVDRYITGRNYFLQKNVLMQESKNKEIIDLWKRKNLSCHPIYWLGENIYYLKVNFKNILKQWRL